jgi:hypothetical protein
MPEYVLDTSLAQDVWRTLDAFTRGYVMAAMWTLTDSWFECDECEAQPDEWNNGKCEACGATTGVHERTESCDHLGLHDIAPETIETAKDECASFLVAQQFVLNLTEEDDYERHGADFWLTRNGHGAGFWDRGYPPDVSRALTDSAHAWGEVYWYVGDDGNVYQG